MHIHSLRNVEEGSCPTQFLQGLFIDDYDFPTDTYLFQDDNAPVHASRETERWKQENNIKHVTWPYQSSDHNIIENMWHTIKIRLQSQITDGALSSWNRYSSVGKWRAITGHKYVSKILIYFRELTDLFTI
jgi:hypothetical protein